MPSDRDLLARIGRSSGGRAGYKQLVRELGLGGGRERRLLLEQLARLTARGLATAIQTVAGPGADARAIRQRSADLGARIRDEDGVTRACEVLDALAV